MMTDSVLLSIYGDLLFQKSAEGPAALPSGGVPDVLPAQGPDLPGPAASLSAAAPSMQSTWSSVAPLALPVLGGLGGYFAARAMGLPGLTGGLLGAGMGFLGPQSPVRPLINAGLLGALLGGGFGLLSRSSEEPMMSGLGRGALVGGALGMMLPLALHYLRGMQHQGGLR